MTTNFHDDNAVAGIRACAEDRLWLQETDGAEVISVQTLENTFYREDSVAAVRLNRNHYSEMRGAAPEYGDSIPNNSCGLKNLDGTGRSQSGDNVHAKCEGTVRMKVFVRWLRFNIVGGIGIFVQFVLLFLMKRVLHFDYLAATALAVEAAVVHNFLWHERYTWADRVQPSWRRSLARLARFNLTTGGVSMVGNLALMRVMVGAGHMNYLVANGIAIVVCSLASFLVSEEWVFAEE